MRDDKSTETNLMDDKYEMLSKAYENLDIELLRKAIEEGADLNYFSDETACGIGSMLEQFEHESDDSYTNESQKRWFDHKPIVIDMLNLAFENGLNINECYDDEGNIYYPLAGFLLYSPDDLGFIDYLIFHGFDPVSRISDYSQFEEIIEILDEDISDPSVSIDHNRWLLKLSLYLMDKFPKLREQHSYDNLLTTYDSLKKNSN